MHTGKEKHGIFLFKPEKHFPGHVAELADALALGASRETCGGSNPPVPTSRFPEAESSDTNDGCS